MGYRPLPRLVVTFFIGAALNFYTLYFLVAGSGLKFKPFQLLAILAYIAALLGYELASQTKWGAAGLGITAVGLLFWHDWFLFHGTISLLRWPLIFTLLPLLLGSKTLIKPGNNSQGARDWQLAFLLIFFLCNTPYWILAWVE